jgi:hypothetical protein
MRSRWWWIYFQSVGSCGKYVYGLRAGPVAPVDQCDRFKPYACSLTSSEYCANDCRRVDCLSDRVQAQFPRIMGRIGRPIEDTVGIKQGIRTQRQASGVDPEASVKTYVFTAEIRSERPPHPSPPSPPPPGVNHRIF